MSLPALSSEDQTKLAHFIKEGIKVKQEVADLNEGLNDVKKHIADELDIPNRDLGKALTLAYRKLENNNIIEEEQEILDTVGEILDVAGV